MTLDKEPYQLISNAEYQQWLVKHPAPVPPEASDKSRTDAAQHWTCFSGPGGRQTENAEAFLASTLDQHPDARVVYADRDQLNQGERSDPEFLPDWNPELFRHTDYISPSAWFHSSIRSADTQPEEAAERISRLAPSQVVHIPHILFHHEQAPRCRLRSPIEEVRTCPLVSIIIPTHNQLPLLLRCLSSLFAYTNYYPFECIVIDHASDDPQLLNYLDQLKSRPGIRVLRQNGPFNYSRLNNKAVQEAKGDILLFLNNDIDIRNGNWLSAMVQEALREDVGAVGTRLFYPDETIQHDGVLLGAGNIGIACHGFKGCRTSQVPALYRTHPRNAQAVTAACLAVQKELFLDAGGFNETDLPVAFNDVDLCLKLLERGKQNILLPLSGIIHHEAASRGLEDSPEKQARFRAEADYMRKTWLNRLNRDPFYNPNYDCSCETRTYRLPEGE